ncbi:hypothetical protein OQZ33_17090 [Pedobacter sp. MC2016-05]|nr:hypothetical protein [Pedobacter sp. MC2016-05]MCX2476052.1 hypothetical protein [Pedobacter sp. MC2016-05]
MLDAFKEFLDGMNREGYVGKPEEGNPAEFYSQLMDFSANYGGLPI